MNKPAYKTFAFWATFVLTNLGLMAASGLMVNSTLVMGAGWIVTVLTALGYRAWKPDPELGTVEAGSLGGGKGGGDAP